MFDFFIPCVRHLGSDGSLFWLPLKIYTSRSSCIRFFKTYKLKALDLPEFGILKLSQDFITELSEVNSNAKD